MDKTKYFEYLDALRESGAVNMFGAGVYLREIFGISLKDSREIIVEWMETFAERHPN